MNCYLRNNQVVRVSPPKCQVLMVSQGTHEAFKGLIISVYSNYSWSHSYEGNFFFYESSVMLIPKANKDFTINKAIDMYVSCINIDTKLLNKLLDVKSSITWVSMIVSEILWWFNMRILTVTIHSIKRLSRKVTRCRRVIWPNSILIHI